MGEGQGAPALRTGRAHGPAAPLAAAEPGIWCWICGRPLRRGEDFGRWRLRAFRPTPRWRFEVCAICPAHYRPP